MKANQPGSGPSPAGVELASIDDLAITPLSDDELDSVAGGYTDTTTAASCQCCVSGATDIPQKSPLTPQ